MNDQQTAIPAATLILFRERAGGAPEILMVERARAMVFAGGALVFPGGRIDPGDQALALMLGGDPVDTAGRIAAIRETVEEVGLAVGLRPSPDPEALTAMRRALHEGVAFGKVLGDAGRKLDLTALVPFARWRPSHTTLRVFDTHFYIARLPDDAPEPEVDATENARLFWSTAQNVLNDADAGHVQVIFPTRRNLERLAQFTSFEEAVADAARYPVHTITPWIEQRGGEEYLCIPTDQGYPITSEPLSGAIRG